MDGLVCIRADQLKAINDERTFLDEVEHEPWYCAIPLPTLERIEQSRAELRDFARRIHRARKRGSSCSRLLKEFDKWQDG